MGPELRTIDSRKYKLVSSLTQSEEGVREKLVSEKMKVTVLE